MKKNVVVINGIEERVSMLVHLPPNDVVAAVTFEHAKRITSIPKPLARCPKVRHIIECQIFAVRGGDVLGEGFSFCRPPDRFNPKEGAIIAFRRAVNEFCESVKYKNYFNDGSDGFNDRRALWNQFTRTKAWRRIDYASKAKNNS